MTKSESIEDYAASMRRLQRNNLMDRVLELEIQVEVLKKQLSDKNEHIKILEEALDAMKKEKE